MVDWRGRKRSDNVIDMRGRGASSGLGRRTARTGGGIGILGIVILVIMFFMGADPMQLLAIALGGDPAGSASGYEEAPRAEPRAPAETDEHAAFMGVVLEDTEETWGKLFKAAGSPYPEAELVLYEESIETACGFGSAAAGLFYCPGDKRLYLDLSFFRELGRMGALGDFAQAYVIGHEVGHHVQQVIGILDRVQRLKSRVSQEDANGLQVLVELQADCYAVVSANHAETQGDLLESGDVEEGLEAAAAIGDDTLQWRAGRAVNPESFTHGSSAQRIEWFQRGMQSGDVEQSDTFKAAGISLR